MQWNRKQVLLLIDAYRSHPVLWDPKNNGYYNRKLKSCTWAELSEQLNRPIDELKKKIVILRKQLHRERMKEERKEYKSHWYAYNHMLFLPETRKRKQQVLSGQLDFKVNGDTPDQLFEYKDQPSTPNVVSDFCLQSPAEKNGRNLEPNVENPVIVEPSMPTVPSTLDDSQGYADYVASKLRTYSHPMRNELQHVISMLLYKADTEEFGVKINA